MGSSELTTIASPEAIDFLSSKLSVVASPERIADLGADGSSDWFGGSHVMSLGTDAPLPLQQLAGRLVVVLEVDPKSSSSMDRIDALRRFDPSISIIVAIEGADLVLIRRLIQSGVADVVALPFRPEDVLQAILNTMEVRESQGQEDTALAPLISVVRSLGGGGASTLITHLAAELADEQNSDPTVCIIDLDVQFGRISDIFNVQSNRTIKDLLEAGDRLDGSFFQSVVVNDDRGIAIVAAPEDIVPVEALDLTRIEAVIGLARNHYDYVLLDLPSSLTNWSLSLVSQSDCILMLAEQNVASLRQARRRIDLLRSLGVNLRLLKIILNRVEKKLFKTINNKDVEQALGMPVTEVLHNEAPFVANAQDQGLLVGELRRKSRYQLDVKKVAEILEENLYGGHET